MLLLRTWIIQSISEKNMNRRRKVSSRAASARGGIGATLPPAKKAQPSPSRAVFSVGSATIVPLTRRTDTCAEARQSIVFPSFADILVLRRSVGLNKGSPCRRSWTWKKFFYSLYASNTINKILGSDCPSFVKAANNNPSSGWGTERPCTKDWVFL